MAVHRDRVVVEGPRGVKAPPGEDRLEETASFLRARVRDFPDIGLILGSGLGDWVRDLPAEVDIPYADIPHFPQPSVAGHGGRFLVVTLGGRRVAVLSGRVHLYEGVAPEDAVFPVRVLAAAGMRVLVTTNASGGLDPSLRVGDLLLIRDHLGFVPRAWSSRFGDPEAGGVWGYDPRIGQHLLHTASALGIRMLEGVLFWFSGPTYETRAEAQMVRRLGGHALSMSTLPDNVAAWCSGVRSAGLSVITNHVAPEEPTHTRHSEVVAVAREAGERLRRLLEAALESWNEGVG